MSELLTKITTGTIERPVSVIVYGVAGCGKSTFAAGAPDPLFIDCDNRTAHLDVRRLKPDTFEDLIEVTKLIARGELKCSTLVIDTLDHAELMLHRDLCKTHNVATIEDVGGGYGKGYVAALGEWRRFAVGMDAIRAKGVGLVMLAHSQVKAFMNPAGENYDQVQMKLDKRAQGFLTERVDGIGYASFGVVLSAIKQEKTKARSTGKTSLSFAPSAAVQTKRFEKYPLTCALTWADFTKPVL
jgi:hypothetical protein